MASKINKHYVDRFIERLENRLEELDSELRYIAAESQRADRAGLHIGQTVRGYKPTTVLGDSYKGKANDAELRAYHDVAAMFDGLDRDAVEERAEAASADEVATVQLALSLDPDEATLRDLWAAYGRNATLRKAIRHAAGKARVRLPIDAADAVADNRGEAREYALSRVSNRWSGGDWAELDFSPSATIDAESVRQHLLGIDLFGRPIE